MIRTNEDALICDLAETYHIFNYRELPIRLVATLSVGLGNDSRIKRELANQKFSISEQLQCAIIDKLNILIWQNSTDGAKGRNQPKPILSMLQEKETSGFKTGADFEKERQRLLKQIERKGEYNV